MQAPVHSPGSREEFSIVESAEPDPPGFLEQVLWDILVVSISLTKNTI